MEEATRRFREYKSRRSTTFAELVVNYRKKYGRHPPPKFDEVIYKFYLVGAEVGGLADTGRGAVVSICTRSKHLSP